MTTYISWRGVIALIREAGFDDSRTISLPDGNRLTTVEMAFCIVQGESAGDPWSTNYNSDTVGAEAWHPGGRSHDCGIVQWNDRWWGADLDSPIRNGDRVAWYADAYNPKAALRWLHKVTDGGVRNWSTWNAYTNGSYAEHLPNARKAIALGAPAPFRKVRIGGRTWIRANTIAARCNPGVSVDRWFRYNPTVTGPKGDTIDLTSDRSRLLQPGTEVRVPFWTTRIQAGPQVPDFAR